METIEFLAVISIPIMCWLFCTFYTFGALYKEKDNIFVSTIKLIVSILFGWLVVPMVLGIRLGVK